MPNKRLEKDLRTRSHGSRAAASQPSRYAVGGERPHGKLGRTAGAIPDLYGREVQSKSSAQVHSASQPLTGYVRLSSAVGDDSFYLAPKLAQAVTIHGHPCRGPAILQKPDAGDLHLSFHESGAVNLHTRHGAKTLRPRGGSRGEQGLAVRLVFNSLGLFQTVSDEEFNALPKRYTPMPVPGLWGLSSVCLDVYQTSHDAGWNMPALGDIAQVHVRVKPKRKASDYHFLVWQHSEAQRHAADVAIFYSPSPIS